MTDVVRQIGDLLGRAFELVTRLLRLLWQWSFGQIVNVFEQVSKFEHLPLWKKFVIIIVIIALIYLLMTLAREFWLSARQIFAALVNIFAALVMNLPTVLVAGAIAFAGAWAINNLDIPWLP